MTHTLKTRMYAILFAVVMCPVTAAVAVQSQAAVNHRYNVIPVVAAAAVDPSKQSRPTQEIQAMNLDMLKNEKEQYDKLQHRYELADSSTILRAAGVADHYRKDKCEMKRRMRQPAALLPSSAIPNDIKTLLAKPPHHHA